MSKNLSTKALSTLPGLRRGIILAAVLLIVAAVILVPRRMWASTPSSGTLTDTSAPLTYDAGPFNTPNESPLGLGQLDSGPRCNAQFPCDNFELTISLPSGYITAHPNASAKVTMFWTDTGSGQSDYDLYIYKGVVGNLGGTQSADYQSATSKNPEVASITPLADGNNKYSLKIVPSKPTQEIVHVRIEFLAGTGTAGFPGFGGPDPTTPGVPRYQNFYAPLGSSAEASQGEFNIGFNPATHRIMVMNTGPIWRLTPPERLTPAKPECCEALWEDKTNTTTITGVDPILWSDQVTTNPKSARIFASNSTAGTNGVYGFSDDDGDNWLALSASPPNSSSDHETIGSGPYPASLSALGTSVNHRHAVYYCAQTYPTGAAACQRSDSYGDDYGPSVIIYNPNPPVSSQCRSLHGHVHVGPDGAAYVPVKKCGANAGLVVSTDGGITWAEHIVPNSATQTHGSDPSIAIGANNTVYFFYVADQTTDPNPSEGHIHVQVSTDKGAHWSKDTDLGATHGIKNAVFPEAVAGDDNRAACGFLGTDRPGDYEGSSFPGLWYAFVATTFDGGDTWNVVNASPNDPVQGLGGIWQGGGSHTNRNLLDFNEITLDDNGRVLFGYDDGCVGDCIGNPTVNSYGARMRVARQSGGKTLFVSNDANTDTTAALMAKPACLSGIRYPDASELTWKAPDNGGSDITGYQILRGTTAGSETVLVSNTGNAKTTFSDTTADPGVPDYFYVVQAFNQNGTVIGPQSNEIDLVVVPRPRIESLCVPPGLTKLTDSAGDNHAVLGLAGPAPPGTDLLSFEIAQPFVGDASKLVFTINTDAGESPQPTGSAWYVAMKIPGNDPAPAPQTGYHYRAVHMAWNPSSPATPIFESYTPSTNVSGGTDGRFVTSGSQKPADASSHYDAPFNKVVIVVNASDLGLNPNDTIGGFLAGVSQSTDPGSTAGAGATELYDQMPNSLAFTGTYTMANNLTCPARLNYALKLNGGTAIASSTHPSGLYLAAAAINDDRTGNGWGTVSGGWNDGTRNAYPDTLEVDFTFGSRVIDEIDVITLQNNWKTAGEPDLTTSASGEGILDFLVQYRNSTDTAWLNVPGGSITGNDKAWRQFTFPAVATTKIRVVVNNARNNWSRIVELEAIGAGGQ